MATDSDPNTTEEKPDSAAPASDPSVIETDSLESGPSGVHPAPEQQVDAPKKGGIKQIFHAFNRKFNIYLLLFILILVISGAVVVISATKQHTAEEPKIASQSVPTDALKQLAKTDATVGDPKQILNVQSNAVFAGKVLIRDSLDVAGTIHVNGSLSLPGITVSGQSSFDQVQVNKTLSIGGDASILGQLNIKKNLSVSGSGTFGGTVNAPQIATSQLQLLGDLTMTRHIIAGGSTPGRTNGGSLGSGGTSSVSGSDTAGSININTGNGTAASSCYLTVSFTTKFNNTPHVVVTPTSSAAAIANYYVTKSPSGFSICTNAAPPANNSLTFDYIVFG